MKAYKALIALLALVDVVLAYYIITTPIVPMAIRVLWAPVMCVCTLTMGGLIEEVAAYEAAKKFRDEINSRMGK